MLLEFLLLCSVIFLLFYRWITKSFNKWKDLGIPFVKPSFPFGSHNFIFEKVHLNEYIRADYFRFSEEKVYGWFLFGKPALGIRDPNILKNIQVKDFNHFVDRNEVNLSRIFGEGGELDNLWGMQIGNAAGETWKDIRSTFTPIFTSGKMKHMQKFMKTVAESLTDELQIKANTKEEFELKNTFGKFSLDTLAACAFGINAESFTNENSVFVKHAAKMFTNSVTEQVLGFAKFLPGVPLLMRTFNINIFKPKSTKFFQSIIVNTLRQRRQSKEKKNDLIDMMLAAMKDDISPDEVEEDNDSQYDRDMKFSHDKKNKEMSEDMIVATAMILLVAGYDTTGMSLSYLSYALANNPEVQEKLQEEVDRCFVESNGDFPDYNTIHQSLPYMDMVIHETLRLYSPIGLNTRSCTEDYRVEGTDIIIKKGDFVTWSGDALQRDPKYWSHPDEFYPEHFTKEEKSSRNPYLFQVFGQGPRACIGMRFALLEMKIAVISVMRRFSFEKGTKTLEPITLDPLSQLAWAKGGLWVKVRERTY